MNDSFLNTLSTLEFGKAGKEALIFIVHNLQKQNPKIGLHYDEFNKQFTLINSKEIKEKDIQKIFDENFYIGWQPRLRDFNEIKEDKVFILIPIKSKEKIKDPAKIFKNQHEQGQRF